MKSTSPSKTLKSLKRKYRQELYELLDNDFPRTIKIVFGRESLTRNHLNRESRIALCEYIFAIEQRLGYSGYKVDIRDCKKLQAVRNMLYDDLGWNETKK